MGKHRAKAAVAKTSDVLAPSELGESRPRALIFISHDSRDGRLAEEFQNLLRDASGGILKSFCSSDKKGNSGIEFGEEWYRAIMSNLDAATNVVALLTKNSLDRPWILYEAGVAKGKLGTPVLGLVVGMPLEDANRGPFAQFQNCGDDEDSITKLAMQLIKQHPDAEPREAAVRLQVQTFLKSIESLPAGKTAVKKPADVDPTIVAKLFEEIKVMFRDLPEKLDGTLRAASRQPKNRHMLRSARHMFHRLESKMQEAPSSKIAADYWLLLVGMYRDLMPGLWDVASQLVGAVKEGNKEMVKITFQVFADAVHAYDEVMHSRRDSEEEAEFMHRAHQLVSMFDHFVGERMTQEKMVQRARKRLSAS